MVFDSALSRSPVQTFANLSFLSNSYSLNDYSAFPECVVSFGMNTFPCGDFSLPVGSLVLKGRLKYFKFSIIFVFPLAPSQPKPILAQIFSSFLCISSIIARKTFTQISLCPSANRLKIEMAVFLSTLASEQAFSRDCTMLAATAKQRNLPRFMVWHLWLMRSKVEFGVTFCCCLQQKSKRLRSCLWISYIFYSFVLAGVGFQNQLASISSSTLCSASFFCSGISCGCSGSTYCACSTYLSSSFGTYSTLATSSTSSFFSSFTSCFSVVFSSSGCSLLFLAFLRSQCTANISLFSMQYLSKLTEVSLLNSPTSFFSLSCTKASILAVKPFLSVLFNLGLLSYFWKLKMSQMNFRHLSLLSAVTSAAMGRVPSKWRSYFQWMKPVLLLRNLLNSETLLAACELFSAIPSQIFLFITHPKPQKNKEMKHPPCYSNIFIYFLI